MNMAKMLMATLGSLMATISRNEIKQHINKIGNARRSHRVGKVGKPGTGGPSRACRRLRTKLGIA